MVTSSILILDRPSQYLGVLKGVECVCVYRGVCTNICIYVILLKQPPTVFLLLYFKNIYIFVIALKSPMFYKCPERRKFDVETRHEGTFITCQSHCLRRRVAAANNVNRPTTVSIPKARWPIPTLAGDCRGPN